MAESLQNVLREVPKALAFVAILVVGWLVARAVRTLVGKVLERTGFNRFADRGGIRATLARSRYDASDIVAGLAYYAVLLIALQLAFGIWGPNPVSALITTAVAWLPRAFVAILIVVVAAAVARAVKDIVGSALGGLSYGRFLAGAASVMILGLGCIAALNQIGVATTVTTPVLIAVLATIGGVIVVGVGGGLIRPMQDRWERWLSRAEEEAPAIAEQARSYEAGKRDAAAAQAAMREEAASREAAGRVAAEQADVEATMPLGTGLSAEETMVIPADATRDLR
jgi:Conserved TM helix